MTYPTPHTGCQVRSAALVWWPQPWRAETGAQDLIGQPQLHSKFKATTTCNSSFKEMPCFVISGNCMLRHIEIKMNLKQKTLMSRKKQRPDTRPPCHRAGSRPQLSGPRMPPLFLGLLLQAKAELNTLPPRCTGLRRGSSLWGRK